MYVFLFLKIEFFSFCWQVTRWPTTVYPVRWKFSFSLFFSRRHLLHWLSLFFVDGQRRKEERKNCVHLSRSDDTHRGRLWWKPPSLPLDFHAKSSLKVLRPAKNTRAKPADTPLYLRNLYVAPNPNLKIFENNNKMAVRLLRYNCRETRFLISRFAVFRPIREEVFKDREWRLKSRAQCVTFVFIWTQMRRLFCKLFLTRNYKKRGLQNTPVTFQ